MEYIILIAAIILLVAVEFLEEVLDVVLWLRRLIKRVLEARESDVMTGRILCWSVGNGA